MAINNLVLRTVNSPYNDVTKRSVLSHEELDNNMIYLKGLEIQTANTYNTSLLLTKTNGDLISVDLSYLSGGTSGMTLYGAYVPLSGGSMTGPLYVPFASACTLENGARVVASGECSHAEGVNTIAYGDYSHVEGQITRTGIYGYNTTSVINGRIVLDSVYGNVASAFTSNIILDDSAFGNLYGISIFPFTTTQFSGGSTIINLTNTNVNTSHAKIGSTIYMQPTNSDVILYSNSSHAEGLSSVALNLSSHAEGEGTIAIGRSSHAEGYFTTSNGFASHAEGNATLSSGLYSHAEGSQAQSLGNYSHAEGIGNISLGLYSHAEGENTNANGYASHAEGENTTAGMFGYSSTSIVNGVIILPTLYGDVTSQFGTTLIFDDTNYSNFYGVVNLRISLTQFVSGATKIRLVDTSINTPIAVIGVPLNTNPLNANSILYSNYSHAEGYNTMTVNSSSHAEGATSQAAGFASHAEGNATQANGSYSHAEGVNTIASGNTSHAEGDSTQANASYSHAEGQGVYANGYSSHAEGGGTTTRGDYSHAEGNGTGAIGDNSHAEGEVAQAYGRASHAEGYQTAALGARSHAEGENSAANGAGSHAEAINTVANGDYSHTEGNATETGGYASHAEGGGSKALGQYSHAEGFTTIAAGDNSHAEGFQTIASGNTSHTEGNFTSVYGDYSHAEGNLSLVGSYGYQSNSIVNGKITLNSIYGDVTSSFNGGYIILDDSGVDNLFGVRAFAYSSVTFSAATEIVLTNNNSVSTTLAYIAIPFNGLVTGANKKIQALYSHAEGDSTIANGIGAHAEGSGSQAIGIGTHAEGLGTISNGEGSHAEGLNTVAYSHYSHAEGETSIASGRTSHAEGEGTVAGGYGSHTEGFTTIAAGDYSHAEGLGTIADVAYQHVSGRYNTIGNSANSIAIIGSGNIGTKADAFRVDLLSGTTAQITNIGNTILSGATNPLRITGLQSTSTDANILSIDGSGNVHTLAASGITLSGLTTLTNQQIAFGSSANTITSSTGFTWNSGNNTLGVQLGGINVMTDLTANKSGVTSYSRFHAFDAYAPNGYFPQMNFYVIGEETKRAGVIGFAATLSTDTRNLFVAVGDSHTDSDYPTSGTGYNFQIRTGPSGGNTTYFKRNGNVMIGTIPLFDNGSRLQVAGGQSWGTILTGGSTTLGSNGTGDALHYVFNGSSPTTWILPLGTGKTGVTYFIKNRGTAALTLSANSVDQLYTTSAVSTITVSVGGSNYIVWDGNYWAVDSSSSTSGGTGGTTLIGDIFNTTFSGISLPSGFSNTGATIGVNNGLTISGGNGSYFSSYLAYSSYTATLNWTQTIEFTVNTIPTGSTEGLFIGRISSNSAVPISFAIKTERVNSTTWKATTRSFNALDAGTQLAETSVIPMSGTGKYRIYLAASNTTAYVRFALLDGSNHEISAATSSYTFLRASPTVVSITPNTGRSWLGILGGSYKVTSFKESHFDKKNIDFAILGDSISLKYNVASIRNHFTVKTFEDTAKTYTVFAGGGDRTSDVLSRMNEVMLSAPRYAIIATGTNDLDLNYATDLTTLISLLQAANIIPIILILFSDASRTVDAYTVANATNVKVVNPYPLITSDMIVDDGTHYNDRGNQKIADVLRAELADLLGVTGDNAPYSLKGLGDYKENLLNDGDLIAWNNADQLYENKALNSLPYIQNSVVFSAAQNASIYLNSSNVAQFDGYVGIGVAPQFPYRLFVSESNGDAAAIIRGENPAATGTFKGYQLFCEGTSGNGIGDWPNATVLESAMNGGLVLGAYLQSIKFQTGNRATNMTLNGSGNLMIGTATDNGAKLQVNGNQSLGVVLSTASTLTLGSSAAHYIYKGSTTTTWTLPSGAGKTGWTYFIKNRGSNTLTLSANSGDQLYSTGATSTLTVNTGEAYILVWDGELWDVE